MPTQNPKSIYDSPELKSLQKQYMEAAYTCTGFGGYPNYRLAASISRKIQHILCEEIVE
jgi:hypothetical protein